MLLVSQYLISMPLKTRPIFLHLCCLDQANMSNFFGSLAARDSPKSSGGGFIAYSSTSDSGGFKFGSSKGGSEFGTFFEIKTDHASGE